MLCLNLGEVRFLLINRLILKSSSPIPFSPPHQQPHQPHSPPSHHPGKLIIINAETFTNKLNLLHLFRRSAPQ